MGWSFAFDLQGIQRHCLTNAFEKNKKFHKLFIYDNKVRFKVHFPWAINMRQLGSIRLEDRNRLSKLDLNVPIQLFSFLFFVPLTYEVDCASKQSAGGERHFSGSGTCFTTPGEYIMSNFAQTWWKCSSGCFQLYFSKWSPLAAKHTSGRGLNLAQTLRMKSSLMVSHSVSTADFMASKKGWGDPQAFLSMVPPME